MWLRLTASAEFFQRKKSLLLQQATKVVLRMKSKTGISA